MRMTLWYLAQPGGTPLGPLGTDAVVRQVQEGSISRDSLVWAEGMERWLALGSVDEISRALQAESTIRVNEVNAVASAPSDGLSFADEEADVATAVAAPAAPALDPPRAYTESWAWGPEVRSGPEPIAPPRATGPTGTALYPEGLLPPEPPGREALPTRFEPLEATPPPASRAAAYAALPRSDDPSDDDELPPPYPPGFPGPDAAPNAGARVTAPLAATGDGADPPATPRSRLAPRLAIALVFAAGLALGIFGARKFVLMRQGALEEAHLPSR